MFIVKNCWGTPSSVWCALASLGHSLASLACVNIRAGSAPWGSKYVLPKKSIWVGQIPHLERCCLWTKVHWTFFAERGRNSCRSRVFPILDITIHSGDICDRSLKLSEVDPNFARFCPPTLFGGGLPNFLGPTLSCRRTFRYMWQSFAAIG